VVELKILILSGKRSFVVKKIKKEFELAGIESTYLNIGKLNLLSRENQTIVKNQGIEVSDFDAIFLKTSLKLTPFVEPLLDEIQKMGIFVQIKPGAYYLNANDGLQEMVLSAKVRTPKAFILANPKKTRGLVKLLKYPVVFKTFVGLKKTQSIIVESPRSLQSIAKSIKIETDEVILKEFIEGDLLECAVIGEKVLCIKRKWKKNELQNLENGTIAKLGENDRKTAIAAMNACGSEIGTVKICKGFVIDVSLDIKWNVFCKKTKKNLYREVAEFYLKKVKN